MLALFLLPILIAQTSASCSDISFSECDDLRSSSGLLLAIQAPGETNCRTICQALGEGCKFFTFEKESIHENCRLYREKLSTFLNHCNVLSGSKNLGIMGRYCNYDNAEGNDVIHGQCEYGTVEERFDAKSWESCQNHCSVLESCKTWRYMQEEGKCNIIGDSDKTCQFRMGLNTPEEKDQGCDCATTSTTTMSTTTGCFKEDGIDYMGNDVGYKAGIGEEACANWCAETEACKFWAVMKSTNHCWIKNSKSFRMKNNDRISGTKSCGVGSIRG